MCEGAGSASDVKGYEQLQPAGVKGQEHLHVSRAMISFRCEGAGVAAGVKGH